MNAPYRVDARKQAGSSSRAYAQQQQQQCGPLLCVSMCPPSDRTGTRFRDLVVPSRPSEHGRTFRSPQTSPPPPSQGELCWSSARPVLAWPCSLGPAPIRSTGRRQQPTAAANTHLRPHRHGPPRSVRACMHRKFAAGPHVFSTQCGQAGWESNWYMSTFM